jgi:hypothetical protein
MKQSISQMSANLALGVQSPLFRLEVNAKPFFVNFKIKEFIFDGVECRMMIIKDETSSIAFEKLKRYNDMIKMQASCVSHDMRAPLGSITFVVDAVIRKTKS